MIIEKTWEGPSLEITSTTTESGVKVDIEGLDLGYLKYMIKHFKAGGKIPKKHAFAIIAKVTEICKHEKTMVELSLPHNLYTNAEASKDELLLAKSKKLTVVGDTHGQFYDVLNLFNKFGFV